MSYFVRDNFFEGWGFQGHPRHWKLGGPDLAPKWVQSHNLDFNDPDDASRKVAAGASLNDRHRGYSYIEFYINELANNIVPAKDSAAPVKPPRP